MCRTRSVIHIFIVKRACSKNRLLSIRSTIRLAFEMHVLSHLRSHYASAPATIKNNPTILHIFHPLIFLIKIGAWRARFTVFPVFFLVSLQLLTDLLLLFYLSLFFLRFLFHFFIRREYFLHYRRLRMLQKMLESHKGEKLHKKQQQQ